MLAMLCLLGSTREHNGREASKSQDGGPKNLNTEKKRGKKKRKNYASSHDATPGSGRQEAGRGEGGRSAYTHRRQLQSFTHCAGNTYGNCESTMRKSMETDQWSLGTHDRRKLGKRLDWILHTGAFFSIVLMRFLDMVPPERPGDEGERRLLMRSQSALQRGFLGIFSTT